MKKILIKEIEKILFENNITFEIANLEQPKVILKDEKMLVDFTKNANKVGALTTTKLGALDSIPSWDEITA